eukprot:TRINITY_DN2720_c0_g1_i1.p1 TRINITY_DN2720_c0_g1~~TRINITY_DN2720_c0_g1_i1.p1  ORF type:complete len:445 (-),score=132.89 TRINITY_DN2720_c0_g1_i1:193-1527(-)
MPEKKKMEQDFGPIVEAKLPELKALCLKGKLAEGIEELLSLEKQTRLAEDVDSTTKVAVFIINICFECKDWKALNESLVTLSKRRGQFKQTLQGVVGEAVAYVDKFGDKGEELENKLKLIDTIRTITEGKIYVENERARLTRKLAKMKEGEGKIKEAADILQEVQVETYGAMEKREKLDFLLEQIRLCLDCKEFVRASLVSKKISSKALAEPDFADIKLRYHEHMIRYYLHDGNHLQVARSWQAIYDTPVIKESKDKWSQALKLIVVNLVLAPNEPEQYDTLLRVYEDKNLNDLPPYKALLKYFLTKELIRWTKLQELYRSELSQHTVFQEPKVWDTFHQRVVQHNIRVISSYYTQITYKRFIELLDLNQESTEKFLSELVTAHAVYAKIDRPKGVVVFNKPLEAAEVLNEWSSNVTSLLDLMEKTCHLIQRENMVQNSKVQAQ